MEARQQRGLELAATKKIQAKGQLWVVPSQAGIGNYTVDMKHDPPTCSCLDHETRGVTCKHIFAVTYVVTREQSADGSTTVTESLTVTSTKQTYTQNPAP